MQVPNIANVMFRNSMQGNLGIWLILIWILIGLLIEYNRFLIMQKRSTRFKTRSRKNILLSIYDQLVCRAIDTLKQIILYMNVNAINDVKPFLLSVNVKSVYDCCLYELPSCIQYSIRCTSSCIQYSIRCTHSCIQYSTRCTSSCYIGKYNFVDICLFATVWKLSCLIGVIWVCVYK